MKTYKLSELRALASKQSYKMAALEGPDGTRLVPFNQPNKSISKQFDLIPQRLSSDARPDGVYWVLLAYNIRGSQQADRFPILKGKPDPDTLAEAEKKSLPLTVAQVVHQEPTVRGWDEALADKQKIAELTNDVKRLEGELKAANLKISELEAELEAEPETEGLADSGNSVVSFLKETVPTFMPALDRFFDLQEKKLNLEAMKLNGKAKHSPGATKTAQRREIVPGSGEHLALIEQLYNQEKDEQMNAELDKLERANPDLYKQVCERLGLEETGEEEGGENE